MSVHRYFGRHLVGLLVAICGCSPPPALGPRPPSPVPRACPDGWICFGRGLFTSKIAAWYAPGWEAAPDAPAPPSCTNPWASSRYRPTKGYYDSSAPATINAHIAELRGIGVDFLVLDFTNGVMYPSKSYDTAKALEHLPSGEGIPYAFAIGSKLWNAPVRPDKIRLDDQDFEAWFVYCHFAHNSNRGNPPVTQCDDPNPAENPWYYMFHGKPLLVNINAFPNPDVHWPNWSDPKFTVGNSSFPVLAECGSRLDSASWWGWVSEYPQFLASDVVTVTPGSNNRHYNKWDSGSGTCVSTDGGYEIDRSGEASHRGCGNACGGCNNDVPAIYPGIGLQQPGALFELEWLRAIKQNPEVILIASFNEFGDETAIEPADRVDPNAPSWPTPQWYEQIATGYGQLRVGLMKDYCYRDEDDTAVYRVVSGRLVHLSKMPSDHPIIILPAGTLAHVRGDAGTGVPLPPDGTLVVPDVGLGALHFVALMAHGLALHFESTVTARKFASREEHVTPSRFWALPFAGSIHKGAAVYAADGMPPAFESDLGALWPFDCQGDVSPITSNGSAVTNIPASEYHAFPRRFDLVCP